ncbi:MAG: hypothetical protein J7J42_07320 [Thermoplasmata archaeon]|nr:hypothetical protein [Thermoplasmata archaeon]
MALGISIRIIIDYISKKKGVEGLKKFFDEVNAKSIIFTRESDINPRENYPGYYLARSLNAAYAVLGKEGMEDLGRYFGERMNVSFRGLLGRCSPKTCVQNIVFHMRKYLPILHTGYRTISRRVYWLIVSKIPENQISFVNGIMSYLFEKHGGVRDVQKTIGKNKIEYTIKL